MTLLEHIVDLKAQLAQCRDAAEATAIYQDCRHAESALMQLTDIASDVADRLAGPGLPHAWQPFVTHEVKA